MAEKDPKKPLEDVPDDEIGSALDEALSAKTRPASENPPPPAPAPAPPPATAAPVDPSTQWFLGVDDRQEGPFTVEQIREKLAAGTATGDTLCWKPGLSDWLEIAHTPDLAGLIVATPEPAPKPAPYLDRAPSVSLSSLVTSELKVLEERPREEPREESIAPETAPSFRNDESGHRESPRSRPPPPVAPGWNVEQPRRGTTYALAGGGVAIVVLAAAVVFLLLRSPAPMPPEEVKSVDAGPAIAVAPVIDAGPAVDAGQALAAAVDAGPEEPPLTPEELAKLPKGLSPQDIMKVVLADRDALAACVDAQNEKDPEVSGKLVMRWDILVSGKTANVEVVTKQFENAFIAGCVGERIKAWAFPRHQEQGKPVDFPFKF